MLTIDTKNFLWPFQKNKSYVQRLIFDTTSWNVKCAFFQFLISNGLLIVTLEWFLWDSELISINFSEIPILRWFLGRLNNENNFFKNLIAELNDWGTNLSVIQDVFKQY